MKRFTAFFIAILILQTSFGQKIYLPGYILRLNGDTLRGLVEYRYGLNSTNKISFKENKAGEKISFTPMEIKGFVVRDEFFISAIIESEISSSNLNTLQYENELVFKSDTTFLQAIVRGSKSLYLYIAQSGKEQFYIRNDSSFELLIYKKYLKEAEGQTVVGENKKFIGQLTIYLHDCPSIQQKLNSTEYRKNSLEIIFKYYYGCINSGIHLQKTTEETKAEFGVIAGLSLTTLNFSSDDIEYLSQASYPVSTNITGGIFLDIVFPRNHRKWSLYSELVFNSYKVSSRYDDLTNKNEYTTYNTTIGNSYLKLNNMLRFKYPAGPLFIYINAGISNGVAINQKNYLRAESTFYTKKTVGEGHAITDTRRWELGFLGGLGIKFKRFSFEVRFESGNGMSDLPSLISRVNRYSFFFGFRI